MGVIVNNCPLNEISDCLISFIQHLFNTPEITPDEFRWSSNDRETKIFISGPFAITRDKVGAMPTITVSRGSFGFHQRGIDNLKSADPNSFDNDEHLDILQGPVVIRMVAFVSRKNVSRTVYRG